LRSQAPHLLEGFCFPVRNEVAAVAALPDLSVGLSVGLIVKISDKYLKNNNAMVPMGNRTTDTVILLQRQPLHSHAWT
jgi:hypothetical protein